ncbi:YchJ family protein [Colwellia psychrerythraea]|uniref:SEC-C motif domain protein n=1 Tax=Colwellia psychrerythraea (strain 34H / ATCC BAA-681) TaxID=167879 RepID=Q47ZA6_COLP3|nr:YchJ family metal-binding protein [Colwellia psychrerythraea]AAZ25047.1 SEC-C motif domain protein [Colwellia psychrerythraea 34H]
MLCPCGSSLPFNACCQLYITQQKHPSTPEQLMRSRFSAYATKNGQYVFDTYAASQRLKQSVTEIQTWADECIWLALKIHESDETTVEFSAYYVVDQTLCELREKSNFTIEQGQWRYIDGDITVHNEIVTVKRNEVCPCNNYPTAWSTKRNKKFKHCCAKQIGI